MAMSLILSLAIGNGGGPSTVIPANSVAPVISGTTTLGSTLSSTTGTWTGPPVSYAYQWKRDGVSIAAATASTYVLVAADLTTSIICAVTATNALGSTAANSNTLGPITAPAPFAAVNGPTDDPFGGSKIEGWSVNYASQPTVATPVPFTNSRQGYTGTDSASADTTASSTPLDTMYVTTTVRQPWPNNASQSALTAALSEPIYSTDTPSGAVTNNSTLVSPKPIAKWALPGRRTVGNSVRLEVVAFHKDARAGKQVSHVVFSATDGTHTVTATVATPAVLAYTGDRNSVIGYGIDLDVSTLNDSDDFTVDAVVYPWIGASSASQRRTIDGTASNFYEFATQTYYKSTAKAASPILAYVTATGVDAVCDANGLDNATHLIQKVSATAATAKANGFATWASAVHALKAATNLTGGFTDGCQVVVSNTTMAIAANLNAGTYQSVSELVVTRDPLETKASCILTMGSAAATLRHNWLRVKDLTFDRAGGTSIWTPLAGQIVMEALDFNNSSRASQFFSISTCTQFWIGCAITSATTQLLGAGTTPTGLVRGCTMTGGQVEIGCVIGNTLTTDQGAMSAVVTRSSNAVLAFNKLLTITSASAFKFEAADATGIAICQNLFEFTSATTNPSLRPSGDDASNNLTHVVIHNNTFAGSGIAGRLNMIYDETDSVRRVHKFISFKGNIVGAGIYTKGDIFHGVNDSNPEGYTIGAPSQAIGQWPTYYGVSCAANFSQYATASGAAEAQIYAGRGSLIGASTVASQIVSYANLFTANAATTYNNGGINTAGNYTLGAGGGTYTLTNNVANTAKGILEVALFNFTLDGVARAAANDHPGALSAAA